MNETSYKSDFVNINGVRLHYIDWGGSGETLLFLTGGGSSALLFHPFASRFTDKFRVLSFTRRGSAQSDRPETGYDLDTLVDDIFGFMDSQNIDKVILAGHSFAGLELIRFTEKYPERVLKLVFIDTVYDGKSRFELFTSAPSSNIQPPEPENEFDSVEDYAAYLKYLNPMALEIWNDSWEQSIIYSLEKNAAGKFVTKDRSSIATQIYETIKTYDAQHGDISVPVLSFVAFSELVSPEYYTDEQKRLNLDFQNEKWHPFLKKESNLFTNNIPQAKVVEIPGGNHYCYISHEELVYEEMMKFL